MVVLVLFAARPQYMMLQCAETDMHLHKIYENNTYISSVLCYTTGEKMF